MDYIKLSIKMLEFVLVDLFLCNSLNIDIVYDIIVYYDVFDIWFFIFVWCCDFVILYLGYIF